MGTADAVARRRLTPCCNQTRAPHLENRYSNPTLATSGTVALTGATGFIGRTLVSTLTLSGWRVRALVRADSADTDFPTEVVTITGNLEDAASMHELITEVDAVVHCAGVVRGASTRYFEKTNVDGVKRLVDIAANTIPSPRLLLMSSLAASHPHLSAYATSKYKGERVLSDGAGSGLQWSVFRPPAVYGPGDREMTPLFRAMAHGVAPVWGKSDARFSLLYVQDLADAVLSWLACETTNEETFELHDGHGDGYSFNEVIDTAERVFGRRITRVRVPAIALKAVSNINLAMAQAFGYAPMLTPGKLRELSHSRWVCDNAALSAATGWQPKVLLETGLLATSRAGM